MVNKILWKEVKMKLKNINKLKNIKCIFLDIDNTLTNSKEFITEYTSQVIKRVKAKGIYVILCTGRTNQYAVEKSKLCNASSIVISSNGTLIYDYELDKVCYESAIPSNLLNQIFKLSIDNNVDCVFNTAYSRYRYYKFYDNNYIKTNNLIKDIS